MRHYITLITEWHWNNPPLETNPQTTPLLCYKYWQIYPYTLDKKEERTGKSTRTTEWYYSSFLYAYMQ